jgi:hypothetical protein
MAWVETDSLSFTARHEEADAAFAKRTLDRLEDLRLKLEERFDEAPGEITVVVHDNPAWLMAAHPLLPAVRLAAAPAGRRYLAGWPMKTELHVLNEQWTVQRAGGEDSERALRGTAERIYAELVLAANNPALPPLWTPRRFLRYLRWAWLIEGGAQYFAGQVSMFRPAVLNRLRAGRSPSFPPSRRDAVILGGTVFDLLERHRGPEACEMMVHRLRRDGPRGNIELAFEASLGEVEEVWRLHLADMVAGPQLTAELVQEPDQERPQRQRRQNPRRQPPRGADTR